MVRRRINVRSTADCADDVRLNARPGDTLVSSDGGDRYTGLDRFGRVIDQNYVNTSTGVSTDRFQFAYDRDSNALYENNLLNSSFSELFHANMRRQRRQRHRV